MFNLDEEHSSLDLFNLLDHKQRELKKTIEDKWNKTHDILLSESEWFMVERINIQKKLLADVCRNEKFSRQGSHKMIQKLEERGLVLTKDSEQNKRSMYVQLTKLGLFYYEEKKKLKQSLEKQTKHALGQDVYGHLKKALEIDWDFLK